MHISDCFFISHVVRTLHNSFFAVFKPLTTQTLHVDRNFRNFSANFTAYIANNLWNPSSAVFSLLWLVPCGFLLLLRLDRSHVARSFHDYSPTVFKLNRARNSQLVESPLLFVRCMWFILCWYYIAYGSQLADLLLCYFSIHVHSVLPLDSGWGKIFGKTLPRGGVHFFKGRRGNTSGGTQISDISLDRPGGGLPTQSP